MLLTLNYVFDCPMDVSASSTLRTTAIRVPRRHRNPPRPATPTTTTRAPIGHSHTLTSNHMALHQQRTAFTATRAALYTRS